MSLKRSIEKQWYGKPTWLWLLAPLSMLFVWLSRYRKKTLQKRAYHAHCPVIVVGNIAVGGTGKTPAIIALVKLLKASGYRPAVVSRGYGAKLPADIKKPAIVMQNADALAYGDEPVLIANSAQCPVWIASDRVAAVKAAEQQGSNVILSDDGLQHYKMARSFEIAVQDSVRGLGNGWCFPVGPLRELPERLATVDFVLNNCTGADNAKPSRDDNAMRLQPVAWVNVRSGARMSVSALPWRGETGANQRVFALAGIGNPSRFFRSLEQLNVFFEPKAFADHHVYSAGDFDLVNGRPVVMTAKDAVKCRAFAEPNWWYLDVEAELPESLNARVLSHCINFDNHT
ncbi:MAG TPA: tetraacyldisaccharide 4'-kinase [Marinagarivorans sp.]